MASSTPTRRRPGVRKAWWIAGALLTVVVVVFATGSVVSALAHEEETVRETFDGTAITSLKVDSRAGSVRILGGDGDRIEMVAEVSHGLRRTELSWEVDDDRLHVESSCPILFSQFCTVTFTFHVPRGMDLDVHADQSIEADTIDGDAVLAADAGHVEVTRMTGHLQLDSDAGLVSGTVLTSEQVQASSDAGRVELEFDTPPTSVTADSDAGSVEIVVPDDGADYRVYADSDASSDDVTVDQRSDVDRNVSATSDAGSVTVRYATS
jgi:hypothetical protein